MTGASGISLPRSAFLLTLAAVLAAVAAAPAAAAPKTGKELKKTLNRIMDTEAPPPGLAVLMQRGGDVQIRRRGEANVAAGTGFGQNKHYRIASMAKAFSGAVTLALVADGKLELDDTLGEWIPGVLPFGENVTIEQALQHTAGLPDYIRQPAFIDELSSDPAQYMTPLELLSYVEDVPLLFDSGTRYGYSDTDNIAIGLVAEAASGLTYDELLAKYVYGPAGLTRTSLPDTIAMPRPYIHGYGRTDEGAFRDDSEFINPALAWASGGIVSTLGDVNRFFRAYVGGKLFGPEEVAAQETFIKGNSSPPGPGSNSAMPGLFRYETGCGTFYGHTGSFPGYRLFAAASRNGKRSVVFTVNEQIVPGEGDQEASKLIRRAQKRALCHVSR